MLRRLVTLVSGPRALWVCVGLGMLLALPGLGAGLVGDDYLWWLMLQEEGPLGQGLPPVLHLYYFVPGGLEPEVLQGQGVVSWWADPDLRIALLRPLAAATHVFDHLLGPNNFVLQHLHSVLWYGLSIAVVSGMYGTVHRGRAAVVGLATLLFAVEDAHAMNVAWLANRHALISLVIGGLAFVAHVRWRRSGETRWLFAALGALSVGLFCGEATLGAAAYLGAWQLTLDRAPWRSRLAAIGPYLVLVALWRLAYDHFGYGTVGSGLYLDPGGDPVGFFAALLTRWPLLQLGQWLQVPVDALLFLPPSAGVALVVVAVSACAGLVVLFLPLLRRSAEARFWALGMSVALVPLCAAFPMDRLLVFAGVGAFGLLALQAEALGWLSPEPRPGTSRWVRGAVGLLLVLHLPLAGLTLAARTAGLPLFGAVFRIGADTAPADAGVEDQVFLFVSGQEFPVAYTPIIRRVEGRPAPARIAILSTFASGRTLLREDDDTLVIDVEGGWLSDPMDRLERDPSVPFQPGERIQMPDFEVEVREVTADGRPEVVGFHFQRSLDDPLYRWLSWGSGGVEPFEVPDIGQTVTLPALSIAALLGGAADRGPG